VCAGTRSSPARAARIATVLPAPTSGVTTPRARSLMHQLILGDCFSWPGITTCSAGMRPPLGLVVVPVMSTVPTALVACGSMTVYFTGGSRSVAGGVCGTSNIVQPGWNAEKCNGTSVPSSVAIQTVSRRTPRRSLGRLR